MSVQLVSGNEEVVVRDSELEDVAQGDPDTSYHVRQVPGAKAQDIAKKHTVQRPRGPQIDAVKVLDDLLDYCLVGWEGVVLSGSPAPCTREHKLMLDTARKQALVQLAATNRVTRSEVRDASFRESADVG